MRLLCVLLATVWLTDQGLARGAMRRGVIQRVATAITAGMLLTAPVAISEDAEWRKVRVKPLAHRASVFYLLLHAGIDGWRVMHVEFVGTNDDREPLFVGLRTYILAGGGVGDVKPDGEPEIILPIVEASLVGHRGLVEENVEVEELSSFEHPEGIWYDQTLLVVRDIKLNHKPTQLESYPPPDTPLEMLSYSVDNNNLLHFFSYPLRRRDCKALGFDMHTMTSHSTCRSANDAFLLIGAPIFAKDARSLVALYTSDMSREKGTGKSVPVLPELVHYLHSGLAVDSQTTTTIATSWGMIKAAR